MVRIIFIAIFCSIYATGFAQTDNTIQVDTNLVVDTLMVDSTLILTDSLEIDASKKKKKKKEKGLIYRFKDKRYPNPTRAAIFSLVLPGAGQFYNKKYWKIPIVYGGLGVLTYIAIDQNDEYQLFKREYALTVDADSLMTESQFTASSATLKSIRNRADKRRQNAVVGIVAVWLLNAVDAYVDAHLKDFDVSEDLTLDFTPKTTFDPISKQALVGFSIGLTSKKQIPKSFFSQ